MYRLFFVIIFLNISYCLTAQEVFLFGQITDETGQPLENCTIGIPSLNIGTTSDDKGQFGLKYQLSNIEKPLLLLVQYLGYESYRQMINSSQQEQSLKIILKKSTIDIPTIEVQPEKNIFFDTKTHIVDFIIARDTIFTLEATPQKQTLGVYQLKGDLIVKMSLQHKYQAIVLSCMNSIHLVGKKTCTQLLKNKRLYDYDTKQYNDYLKPCVLAYEGKLIFEQLTHHQQQKAYYYLANKQKTPIHAIKDKAGEKSAQQTYYEIIGLYYQLVANPRENSIDQGFHRENIIEAGLWDGDIRALAIDRELDYAISYYENIECRPINSQIFNYYGRLIISDFNAKEWIIIKNKTPKIQSIQEDFEPKTLLQDQVTRDLYLLTEKEIFRLNKKLKPTLAKLSEGKSIFHIKKHIIYRNQYYSLGQLDANRYTSSIIRQKIQ